MVSLPKALTASTGMDALTHAIEAYIGKNDNPIVKSLAATAVTLIARNLPLAYRDGTDLAARQAMAHGSLLAGLAMDQGGLGIVHSLSSALCGILHVAHGEGNALLLPYGMGYNIAYAAPGLATLAALMGVDTKGLDDTEAAKKAVAFVEGLQMELGLEKAMEDIRGKLRLQQDLTLFGTVSAGMFLMKNNPHPATAEECVAIFESIRA
jgi:alcohol dehydrogenase